MSDLDLSELFRDWDVLAPGSYDDSGSDPNKLGQNLVKSGFMTMRQDTKIAVLISTTVHIEVVVKSQVKSMEDRTASIATKRMMEIAQALEMSGSTTQYFRDESKMDTYKNPRAKRTIMPALCRSGSRIRATTGNGKRKIKKSEAMWIQIMAYIQSVL